jgi:hypothetical protein
MQMPVQFMLVQMPVQFMQMPVQYMQMPDTVRPGCVAPDSSM